jgi:hypothetical protein
VLIDGFLARLNSQADLHGQQRVAARTVEDWAYEDLIRGPQRRNGRWDWAEQSLADAKMVLEYRSRGFKRVAAIKAQWWLEGRDLAVHKVREAVISEYKRARNLALRRISSVHGLRRDVGLTEYRRSALRRQLGPLDPVLKQAGFDLGAAVVTVFYEIARFGELISHIDEDTEPIAALVASAVLPNGLHVFAGLWEIDDDHPLSAARAMRQLTNEQFDECRIWAGLFPIGLILGEAFFALLKNQDEAKQVACKAAINNWSKWPWSIMAFAFMANIYYHIQIEDTNRI